MKGFSIFILLLLSASCGKDPFTMTKQLSQAANSLNSSQNSSPKDCSCPMTYAPVCGENGVTYSNSCASNCVGVKIKRSGNCDCTKSSEVCINSKETQPNECEALAKGLSYTYGACGSVPL